MCSQFTCTILAHYTFVDILEGYNFSTLTKYYGNTLTLTISRLTLKAPRTTASENVVCLCRLLNILADFSNLFLYTGKQCGP